MMQPAPAKALRCPLAVAAVLLMLGGCTPEPPPAATPFDQAVNTGAGIARRLEALGMPPKPAELSRIFGEPVFCDLNGTPPARWASAVGALSCKPDGPPARKLSLVIYRRDPTQDLLQPYAGWQLLGGFDMTDPARPAIELHYTRIIPGDCPAPQHVTYLVGVAESPPVAPKVRPGVTILHRPAWDRPDEFHFWRLAALADDTVAVSTLMPGRPQYVPMPQGCHIGFTVAFHRLAAP